DERIAARCADRRAKREQCVVRRRPVRARIYRLAARHARTVVCAVFAVRRGRVAIVAVLAALDDAVSACRAWHCHGRDRQLAEAVVAPADHCAVGFEPAGMKSAERDACELATWPCGDSESLRTPAEQHAVAANGATL